MPALAKESPFTLIHAISRAESELKIVPNAGNSIRRGSLGIREEVGADCPPSAQSLTRNVPGVKWL